MKTPFTSFVRAVSSFFRRYEGISRLRAEHDRLADTVEWLEDCLTRIARDADELRTRVYAIETRREAA